MKKQSYLSKYTQHELFSLWSIVNTSIDNMSNRGMYYTSCATLNKNVIDYFRFNLERYEYSETLLKEYRRVCRARDLHVGFRDYSYEEWCEFSPEKKQKIRIKKLTKFKDHIEAVYDSKKQELNN